jgi:beta-glucosidase
LVAFERLSLKPDEKRSVRFQIGRAQLSHLDRDMKPRVEPGEFRVLLGPSSDTAAGLERGIWVE